MARVLFHIDLNAFFASAEELRHPEYKGKPLAIGSLSSRGVLSTCNYKAREYGIHSAMPTMQARQLCEDLIIVPGDMKYYRELSRQFFDYLRQYSGALEILSVDECFLDVTELIRQYKRPLDLAVQIQQGVKKKLGLSCSIGVAPTRFLAKMASDMRKPMGITVLRKSEIEKKLFPLDVAACYGIGKKTVPLLYEKGIKTIEDLANPENEMAARAVLMNSYDDIQDKIHGRSSAALSFSSTRKSISHSRTFSHDLYTLEEVLEQCRIMCRELCEAMEKARRKGAQISIVLRDQDFNNKVRSARLPEMTRSFPIIYEAASALFIEHFEPVGYRHIGVTIGSLENEDQIVLQPKLFDLKINSTSEMIQSLNGQFDSSFFMTGADLLKKQEAARKQEEARMNDLETDAQLSEAADKKQPEGQEPEHA